MSKHARKTGSPAGGLAAREQAGPLWQFTGDDGSFRAADPQFVSGLYFPLCNRAGMRCSVTPELKGDVCSDFEHYLSIPTVTEDLHRTRNSRNFWLRVDGREPWSVAGVSAFAAGRQWDKPDDAEVRAGVGWFRVTRTNRALGLRAEVTVSVPADDETVEVMKVSVENVGRKPVRFTPTAAVPIFARQADNLRDHRQVTTMFNTVEARKYGVLVTPSIVHDETGHRPNETFYAVLAFAARGAAPRHVWSNVREFCGEGGTLDNPEAVWKNTPAPKQTTDQRSGREAIGAMRWSATTLKPGASTAFVVVSGIASDRKAPARWQRRYGNAAAADKALDRTVAHWRRAVEVVRFETPDDDYDNWIRWAVAQLFYRKIYGNSYLPDFGYGRGGRGWRDLWSDLLSLFLVDPAGSREEMINNFRGVRVDGTNATIIGTAPGEFKADRNDIVRVWCDHAAWPWFVMKFYIDQTGDDDVLLGDLPYWKDHLAVRCRRRDEAWDRSQGHEQRDARGRVYRGTLLEHILLEVLTSFYHVGDHGNIYLEGGDWNDTYDNARTRGESVCFTHFYAWDLRTLAETLETLNARGVTSVELLDEMLVLLDRLDGQKTVRYTSPAAMRKRLSDYMERVAHSVSGKRVRVATDELAADLRAKADHLTRHLRRNEFIRTRDGQRFFNGHYDDHAQRVDGDHPNGVRMDLTSQVLPTMFATADDDQIDRMYAAVRTHLRNPDVGGLRLCTDFGELKLDFGRVTGFVYGYKEHGSIWNQQNMMYMYGLYQRGRVRAGYEVFRDIYALVMDSGRSKIFPCIPSFFDREGRGGYCYLTGSATWLVLASLTQMFGLRGDGGDLVIAPQLVAEQFGPDGRTSVSFNLHGKRLHVTYLNADRCDWGDYAVRGVRINGTDAPAEIADDGLTARIAKDALLAACTRKTNAVEVTLG
ncbi:MAG: cellobiose phosphorylase [Phycisphaerae bacterium]|nr:cellobiose phosphorylase [Phycisphaerae bacterium]